MEEITSAELFKVIGKNVKYYRFMQNYSQERLGELSGLSTHYISDIEQGKYSPSIPTIENIAKALDVDPYLLFIANPKANKLEPRVDIHRKK